MSEKRDSQRAARAQTNEKKIGEIRGLVLRNPNSTLTSNQNASSNASSGSSSANNDKK